MLNSPTRPVVQASQDLEIAGIYVHRLNGLLPVVASRTPILARSTHQSLDARQGYLERLAGTERHERSAPVSGLRRDCFYSHTPQIPARDTQETASPRGE